MVAIGLGFAGQFRAEPRLHTVLRYAGGAYLLYLAWCIGRVDAGAGGAARPRPIGFIEALLFQVVNTKGWVFAIGALAAYTTVGDDVRGRPRSSPS